MASGAFKVEAPSGYTDYSGNRTYQSMAERVSFDKTVVVKSVWVYYSGIATASAPLWIFRVWKVSDPSTSVANENLWGSSTNPNGWYEMQLSTPVALQANTEYSIGFNVPAIYGTYLAYDSSNSASYLSGLVTPATGGPVVQWYGQTYYNATDVAGGAMPTTVLTNNLLIKLSVDVWNLPTVSSVSPTYGDNSSAAVRLNYTYSSPQSAAQTKNEVSYRVSGSTGAYTTITNTTSNAYYDVPAATFADGIEYEVRVRAFDGTAWGNYTTITFTGGVAPWTYGTQVSSSASSGFISGLTGGTYQVEANTSDGFGFGQWSAPVTFKVNNPPTATVTDAQPRRVGTNLNVTWAYSDIEGDPQSKYQIRYRKRP
jgi:hypothetical protein